MLLLSDGVWTFCTFVVSLEASVSYSVPSILVETTRKQSASAWSFCGSHSGLCGSSQEFWTDCFGVKSWNLPNNMWIWLKSKIRTQVWGHVRKRGESGSQMRFVERNPACADANTLSCALMNQLFTIFLYVSFYVRTICWAKVKGCIGMPDDAFSMFLNTLNGCKRTGSKRTWRRKFEPGVKICFGWQSDQLCAFQKSVWCIICIIVLPSFNEHQTLLHSQGSHTEREIACRSCLHFNIHHQHHTILCDRHQLQFHRLHSSLQQDGMCMRLVLIQINCNKTKFWAYTAQSLCISLLSDVSAAVHTSVCFLRVLGCSIMFLGRKKGFLYPLLKWTAPLEKL